MKGKFEVKCDVDLDEDEGEIVCEKEPEGIKITGELLEIEGEWDYKITMERGRQKYSYHTEDGLNSRDKAIDEMMEDVSKKALHPSI